ncbi:hypothetical protein BJ875DRAFT_482158 [Amylocarpus encephaloides]|uniref:Uncharacterized protein n=1 Tax=Amylocarpus encephaloides TaxID=45428 RepID=A0A9P7YNV5_9HELO|nr:hypothetical protein BJ875DRAFT_482158 [Amylocarpus encephaloides]
MSPPVPPHSSSSAGASKGKGKGVQNSTNDPTVSRLGKQGTTDNVAVTGPVDVEMIDDEHSESQEDRQPIVPASDRGTATSMRDLAFALARFVETYPNYLFVEIQVSGEGLECGIRAIIATMRAGNCNFDLPSESDLRDILHRQYNQLMDHPNFKLGSPQELQQVIGLDNFSVDQLGGALRLWGEERGLVLQLGWVVGNQAQLAAIELAGCGPVTRVWIGNNGANQVNNNLIGHYCGLRQLENALESELKEKTEHAKKSARTPLPSGRIHALRPEEGVFTAKSLEEDEAKSRKARRKLEKKVVMTLKEFEFIKPNQGRPAIFNRPLNASEAKRLDKANAMPWRYMQRRVTLTVAEYNDLKLYRRTAKGKADRPKEGKKG